MVAPKVVPMLLLPIVIGCMAGIAEATWCVAKAEVDQEKLQAAMDWACGHGADCGPIQPNGPCFNPNSLNEHASYAFSSYYQHHNKASDSCDFGGLAIVTKFDPSMGNCKYPSFARSVGGANDSAKSKRRVTRDARKLAQTLPTQKL